MAILRNKLFLVVMAATAAILAYQLFVPPIVGLADQGDFIRTIRRFGYAPQHHAKLEYVYVEPKYVPDAHTREPDWEQASTEYLFVGASLLLNKLISRDGSLDITVIGLVHVLAFLAVLARLLWVARRHRAYGLIWIGALVMFMDAGYAIYWNSFYAEPASCIFYLLLLADGIEIGRAGEASPASLLRWSLWAVLWIFAKPQNTPLALILAPFTLRLAFWTNSRATALRTRALAVAGGCAMLGCAAYNMIGMPKVGHMANTYGMIFAGILPDSKDRAADLRTLGLDPQLAKYSGSGAWTSPTAFPAVEQSGVLERKVTTFSILRFYLLRPAHMWRRLKGVLPYITYLRFWYGNFEPSSGRPPAAQSHAFVLWTRLHERLLPRVNKWVVFALAGWPLVAAWKWFRERDGLRRKRIELVTLLPICCLAALLGAVFGDAFDLIKHMFLFNLLLDTCMIYAAATGWNAVAARLRKLQTTSIATGANARQPSVR